VSLGIRKTSSDDIRPQQTDLTDLSDKQTNLTDKKASDESLSTSARRGLWSWRRLSALM